MRIRLAFLISLFAAVAVRAANWPEHPTLRAVRVSVPPHIDGDLSDAAWQTVPEFTDFTQHDPDDGQPTSMPTSVRIVYDDHAIYFGAKLTDPHPPTALLFRRDTFGQSDFLSIKPSSPHYLVAPEYYLHVRTIIRRTRPLPRRVSKRHSVLDYLNMPFTLWVLTLVCISIGGGLFTLWRTRQDHQLAQQQSAERLDLEISYRFSRILHRLRERQLIVNDIKLNRDLLQRVTYGKINVRVGKQTLSEFDVALRRVVATWLSTHIDSLDKKRLSAPQASILVGEPLPKEEPPLFPDFANQSLVALILKLREGAARSDRVELDATLNKLHGVSWEWSEESAASAIISTVMLPRWKAQLSKFRFCGDSNPLCLAAWDSGDSSYIDTLALDDDQRTMFYMSPPLTPSKVTRLPGMGGRNLLDESSVYAFR